MKQRKWLLVTSNERTMPPSKATGDNRPLAEITRSIVVIRGHNVLLDASLAALYGVPTKRLNEQVRRNVRRFPEDFMFRLSANETLSLRSQNATSKFPAPSRGGRRYLPSAFTEQGVAMLSSVLHSEQAVAVNIEIMRAFLRMRALLQSNQELARRFEQLEARLDAKVAAHDDSIRAILAAIRALMKAPPAPRRGIGFTADLEE
jgi:ORF6N domain